MSTVSDLGSHRRSKPTFWDQFGDALRSRNLWLFVAALEVALTLLSQLPADIRKPPLNLAAGFISSAALLAVIWCGWVLLLRRLAGVARVAAAVPVIVAAGVVRGAVLQWLLVSWGMSQAGAAGYQYRMLASVTVVVLGSVTGALVKTAVDGHRARLEALAAEQQRLAAVLAEAGAGLRADQSGAMASISSYLAEQVAQVQSSTPVVAIDSLEQMASDVVRPLSHELATNAPTWKPPELSKIRQDVDWSRVWGSMASVGSIDAVGPAIVTLIVTPTSVLAMGLARGALVHIGAAVLVYLGLWAIRRLASGVALRQPTSIRLGVTSMLLVVACIPAAIAVYLVPGSSIVNSLYMVLVVPLVALLLSFVRAARVQQREIDENLSAVVDETQWWVARTRMVRWWQSAALARALHGPVQSTIHLAVAKLRGAVDAGTATPALVESALGDVRRSLPNIVIQGRASGDIADELVALGQAWQPLVVIEYSVDDSVADLLQSDLVCAEIAADIVTEAVSNAIRHGGARNIVVAIRLKDNRAISVAVDDDGQGWKLAGSEDRLTTGLGTTQLDTCSLQWRYSNTTAPNRLSIELPLLQSG